MTDTEQILKAIEKGMLKAQRKYWYAAGTFFNNYPEYYLRGIIFDSLLRETGYDTLTLETKYRELAENVKNTPWARSLSGCSNDR